MKTISFLIYSMDIGGTERVTFDLINALYNKGYNIYLFCLIKQGSLLNGLLIPDKNIIEIGIVKSFLGIFYLAKKLKRLLNQTKTEGFISMGEWPNIITPFVNYKGKYVLVEHNVKTFYTAPYIYNLNFPLRIFSKIAYEKASRILCVSKNIQDLLISKNRKFKYNSYVIYNPIDFNKIKKLSNEKIEYKYQNNHIKIINVGRLTEQKNITLLLKAFAKVKKENNNIELWLVGDGSIRTELEELVKQLGIMDSVIFWGYQNNPYKFIYNADFFVSSSDYEGFPLVTLETLSLKKRIITTRSITDFDELINDDVGVVVEVNNEKQLINAMLNEINNKKTIDSIPNVLDQFTIDNILNKYLYYLNN